MFKDSFKELKSAKIDDLLKIANSKIDGSDLDAQKTKALTHALPFYAGYQFIELKQLGESPSRIINIIAPLDSKKWAEDNLFILDGTNKALYALNQDHGILLDDQTVLIYAQFFFHYVHGANGVFQIINNLEDIQWHEEPAMSGRKALEKLIAPLSIKEKSDDGFVLIATIIFKNSFFKSDILIKKDGMISLSNQEILVEDLPIAEKVFQ